VIPGTARADRRAAAAWLDDIAQRCADAHDRDARTVEARLIDAWPGPELAAVSEDADVITVGSRGITGFRARHLGSVATYLATHAACPVVIHHPPRHD